MWTEYITSGSVDETLRLLAEKREKARLLAGATDLMLELERGVRRDIGTVIDITRLPNLDHLVLDEAETIHIGALVTHNSAASSRLLRERAFPLVSAAWQVGAPQIRNRATVAGNLVTASPANDTITPLMALGAWVELASIRGTRRVSLHEFYTGVRRTVLQPDEMLVEIGFQALKKNQRGTFLKLGLRRAQAISLVNTAVILTLDPQSTPTRANPRVLSAVITLGAVAPTIIHAPEAEAWLAEKELTDEVIAHAARLAAGAARPIDDIRGSAAYRKAMVQVLVSRALHLLREDRAGEQVPVDPVLLKSPAKALKPNRNTGTQTHCESSEIQFHINGKKFSCTNGHDKSLLRLLREDAGLTGTKEGCAEGECGACTVFMDGKAVMACLVPAPRAHGAEIVTIEGLSKENRLHPVQQTFIDEGAVQCGYCTPGFIMSAAKLLEERPRPSREEITQALTGNLCRCTGYYKIIQAVENASMH